MSEVSKMTEGSMQTKPPKIFILFLLFNKLFIRLFTRVPLEDTQLHLYYYYFNNELDVHYKTRILLPCYELYVDSV